MATLLHRRSLAAISLGRPADAQADAEAAMLALSAYGARTAARDGGVAVARAALWNGDADRLARAIAEIRASGLVGRWVDAITETLEAGLAARRGETNGAAERYADAAAAWRRLDLPLQLGLCRLEAAALLPAGSEVAVAAREEARATLEGLGARAFLERLAGGLVRRSPVAGVRRRATAFTRPASSPAASSGCL